MAETKGKECILPVYSFICFGFDVLIKINKYKFKKYSTNWHKNIHTHKPVHSVHVHVLQFKPSGKYDAVHFILIRTVRRVASWIRLVGSLGTETLRRF